MASRIERCNRCRKQLFVLDGARTIHCSNCQQDTRIWFKDPFEHTQESIFKSENKMKELLHSTSSEINTVVAQVNNYVNTTNRSYSHYSLPRPPTLHVSTTRRKRAVLCGVNYYGSRDRLHGCINDIRLMERFLIEKLGFLSDCIYVLSEKEPDPSQFPTKRNIKKALRWLVRDCQQGDTLIFHFSGHGSQKRDLNWDEMDGYDETLWPVDHQTAGVLVDDKINKIIVRPLPHGAKLHAIIDACHSGTILDLRYVCKMNREGYYKWEDHRSSTFKGTSGGLAISFTACDDHQTSVDTTACTRNALGPLTFSFIEAFRTKSQMTYGSILNSMCKMVRQERQEPQLSSSTRFDIYSEPFML